MAIRNLKQSELRVIIEQSLRDCGWNFFTEQKTHPHQIHAFNEINSLPLKLYIRNCTHGGGAKRPKDEFRIQITGAKLEIDPTRINLLLGWHSGYSLFVGWDLFYHVNQRSKSPSMQVKEAILEQAVSNEFAIQKKSNDEIVVAFQPTFLTEYAQQRDLIHGIVRNNRDLKILENISSFSKFETKFTIEKVSNKERRLAFRQILQRTRDASFSKRVLNAYGSKCAMCGIQLRLVDAAHIVPVAIDGSTDETSNGIALCALHHRAFDNGFVSFNEKFRIQVSNQMLKNLKFENMDGGLNRFKGNLRSAILLPPEPSLRPKKKYIQQARQIRGWT